MLKYLPSETDSELILNEYYLTVELHFEEDSDCLKDEATVSVPMSIIPLIDPNTEGFPEPMGYSGYELGFFRFELEFMRLTLQTYLQRISYDKEYLK